MNMMSSHDPVSPEYRYCLLRTAQERAGGAPGGLPEATRIDVERLAAESFELERRVLSAPEASGVVVPESEVEAACAALEGRYEEAGEFHRDLAANGLDPDGLRRALAWHLRVEAVLERVAASVPRISATDAEIFYRMNPARFQRPETRTVRHILITLNDDFPENRREAAQARLEEIAAGLRADPQGFPAAALAHSECPSAMHEGLVGRVPRGQLFPELDRVLFTLAAGEVSDVVESEIGLHLLWCEAIHPAGPAPLDEVLEPLRDKLTRRAGEQAQRHWLRALKGG